MPLIEEIKKPFNLLTIAIAAISLALSFYFYFESKQQREPLYLSHPSSQIYSKINSSPKLRLIDKAGIQIIGDVHVIEFSFWNQGRQAIEATDARTPVYVQFPKGTTILDYSIVKENKPEITSFKLAQITSPNPSTPRIGLSWTHLDPGLGARLQVIYVGEKNPSLIFGGDILGAEISNGAGVLKRIGGDAAQGGLVGVIGALAFEFGKQTSRRVPEETPKWRRRLIKFLIIFFVTGSPLVLSWALFMGKAAPV